MVASLFVANEDQTISCLVNYAKSLHDPSTLRITSLQHYGMMQLGSETVFDLNSRKIDHTIACEALINERTSAKIKFNGSCGDLDWSIKTRLLKELSMVVNAGFNLRETDHTEKHKLYQQGYFGVHFDMQL